MTVIKKVIESMALIGCFIFLFMTSSMGNTSKSIIKDNAAAYINEDGKTVMKTSSNSDISTDNAVEEPSGQVLSEPSSSFNDDESVKTIDLSNDEGTDKVIYGKDGSMVHETDAYIYTEYPDGTRRYEDKKDNHYTVYDEDGNITDTDILYK